MQGNDIRFAGKQPHYTVTAGKDAVEIVWSEPEKTEAKTRTNSANSLRNKSYRPTGVHYLKQPTSTCLYTKATADTVALVLFIPNGCTGPKAVQF